MIVEFTGSSGAGKTLLRREVARELQRRGRSSGLPVTTLWGNKLASWQSYPRMSNLLLDTVVPAYCLARIRGRLPADHYRLSRYCMQAISMHAKNLPDRLRLLRSATRKLALDNHFRQERFQTHSVLIDEGLIHLAAMIFGRDVNAELHEECREYGALTPRPQLLVWVSAPLELLEERIAARHTHQPLPGATGAERRRYLSLNEEMIAAVIGKDQTDSWVLKIDNHHQDTNTLKNHVLRIADTIDALQRAA